MEEQRNREATGRYAIVNWDKSKTGRYGIQETGSVREKSEAVKDNSYAGSPCPASPD